MPDYPFYIQPAFEPPSRGGLWDGGRIRDWLLARESAMGDDSSGPVDFASLSERLLLNSEKDFLIWDDVLKAGEMTFFADHAPLKGPILDLCCGYGFWTARMLRKIDVGVDLFPDEGPYARSIDGFVQKNFITGAYRCVLQADVTSDLPLPDRFFNSIVSVCSLEHIPEVEKVLASIARLLKPGGHAYLSLQTDRYIEVFSRIFNPRYVQWVRDAFAIHHDRSWKAWQDLIAQAGLVIEERRFLLSEEQTALKALSYWSDPFKPVLGELGLEQAVREIPRFRQHYFDKVRDWSRREADPDSAAIFCCVCRGVV